MKLKNKTLLIIGLASLLSLVSVMLITQEPSWLVISLFLASSLVTLLGIRYWVLTRVEKLDKNLHQLTQENSLLKMKLTGKDEITSITASINALLNNIQSSQQEIEKKVQEKILEIQQSNELLHQTRFLQTDKTSPASSSLLGTHQNQDTDSLPNGVFFNEILNKAINHAARRKQNLAVLLIDIDEFKKIQEKIGDGHGDLVLKEMGKRFTHILRKEDFLAKLDGDTFIVLLNDINKPKFASMAAEKILNAASQLLKIDEQEFNLSVSIGISIFPNDGASLENLIDNANNALFKAKQAGGNNYQFSAEKMHIEALEYIQLESALRKAIHNNELALYFQPMYKVKTGNISSVEGLMRWEHPVLGIIDPAKFIQLAEDSGLIIQIGEWALQEAAQRIKYWQNEGYAHVSVALKLSPKQFHHPDIHLIISKVLTNVGINPKFIEFEITEKAIMENVESAETILQKIKATGVQISMDHFGTGYTSIHYLKHFPISSIKIDKSYIKGIPNNPDDLAIVSAMIALAHSLGLEIIAEGVESAEQIQYLSGQQCDIVQGYFLSHPVSAQKIVLQFKKLQEEVLV